MPRIKLSRREWMLFLFPCALLLLLQLDKIRDLDASRLAMALNPITRGRENVRRANCQSNMKKIAVGLVQYQQDYDGRFPLNTTPMANWVHSTQPYIYVFPDWHCPSDPSPRKMMVPSYWMNANLNEKGGRGVKGKDVDRPERTFLLGEWHAARAKSPFTLNEKGWNSKAAYDGRHLFGANYAFVDGHVKWILSEDIRALQLKSRQSQPYSWKSQG